MIEFFILYSGVTTGMLFMSLCTQIRLDPQWAGHERRAVQVQLLACTLVVLAAVSMTGVLAVVVNALTWSF